MPLKAVIDSLDSVPEGLREYYTEGEGGKFFLAADGVDDLPAVKGLKSAHEKTKQAEKEARERLKAFEGIDPDEARTAAEKARKAEEAKLGADERVEAERKRMQTAFESERETFKGQLAERDAVIRKLLVDNTLSAELDKAKVLPEFREAVKALFEKQQPQVVSEGGVYRAVFKTDVGDIDIAQHVTRWAISDAAKPFISASGTTGSGATGGGGGGAGEANPWAKETHNLTRQGEIVRADPAKAKRLAAAAGVTLNL